MSLAHTLDHFCVPVLTYYVLMIQTNKNKLFSGV